MDLKATKLECLLAFGQQREEDCSKDNRGKCEEKEEEEKMTDNERRPRKMKKRRKKKNVRQRKAIGQGEEK